MWRNGWNAVSKIGPPLPYKKSNWFFTAITCFFLCFSVGASFERYIWKGRTVVTLLALKWRPYNRHARGRALLLVLLLLQTLYFVRDESSTLSSISSPSSSHQGLLQSTKNVFKKIPRHVMETNLLSPSPSFHTAESPFSQYASIHVIKPDVLNFIEFFIF